jgi:hypothetical protein
VNFWATFIATVTGAGIAAFAATIGIILQFKLQMKRDRIALLHSKLELGYMTASDLRELVGEKVRLVASRKSEISRQSFLEKIDRLRMIVDFHFPSMNKELSETQSKLADFLLCAMDVLSGAIKEPDVPRRMTETFNDADKAIIQLQQALAKEADAVLR